MDMKLYDFPVYWADRTLDALHKSIGNINRRSDFSDNDLQYFNLYFYDLISPINRLRQKWGLSL